MRRFLGPLAALGLLASACSVKTEGAPCSDDSNCPSDQGCGADGTCSMAARCPAPGSGEGQGCAISGDEGCSGNKRLACSRSPVNKSPTCMVWGMVEDCGGSLTCQGAGLTRCDCSPGGPVFYVDKDAPFDASRTRSGALDPPQCRYTSVADALQAANDLPDTVAGREARIMGWSDGGSTVVLAETTVLHAASGVTLGTADVTPDFAHYRIDAPATPGNAFLTLDAGARVSGVEIANAGFTGDAVATNCTPGSTVVIIDNVKIASVGSAGERFRNGIRHAGNCSLDFRNSTIAEADDTGVVIDNAGDTTSLTMWDNTIQKNLANRTRYTIGGVDRSAGGLVVMGNSLPGVASLQRNNLLSNAGDQLLVFAGSTLSLDVSVAACDGTSNLIACYTAPGVGVATKGAAVEVAHTNWTVSVPGLGVDYIGNVLGTTQPCGPVTVTCP